MSNIGLHWDSQFKSDTPMITDVCDSKDNGQCHARVIEQDMATSSSLNCVCVCMLFVIVTLAIRAITQVRGDLSRFVCVSKIKSMRQHPKALNQRPLIKLARLERPKVQVCSTLMSP